MPGSLQLHRPFRLIQVCLIFATSTAVARPIPLHQRPADVFPRPATKTDPDSTLTPPKDIADTTMIGLPTTAVELQATIGLQDTGTANFQQTATTTDLQTESTSPPQYSKENREWILLLVDAYLVLLFVSTIPSLLIIVNCFKEKKLIDEGRILKVDRRWNLIIALKMMSTSLKTAKSEPRTLSVSFSPGVGGLGCRSSSDSSSWDDQSVEGSSLSEISFNVKSDLPLGFKVVDTPSMFYLVEQRLKDCDIVFQKRNFCECARLQSWLRVRFESRSEGVPLAYIISHCSSSGVPELFYCEPCIKKRESQ